MIAAYFVIKTIEFVVAAMLWAVMAVLWIIAAAIAGLIWLIDNLFHTDNNNTDEGIDQHA